MRPRWIVRCAVCAFACTVLSTHAWGQDTSTTTVQKGPSSYQTQIKSGTVVYVSGNDLVVKGDNGVVKHFVIPESETFTVDGQQVSVHQLKAGTHLTQTITTKTTPRTITTVRTIEGKVWYVNAPSMVIVTLPDNTNKEYKVPKGQMFNINGTEKSIFHLKKGMTVSATVVTEVPETHVSTAQAVTGAGPAVPDHIDTLLVESPTAAPQPTETASTEPAPTALPKTGSEWPLVGLLGAFSLGLGGIVRRVRLMGN
jgi:LPXTG-motif cell wall-anchored protein